MRITVASPKGPRCRPRRERPCRFDNATYDATGPPTAPWTCIPERGPGRGTRLEDAHACHFSKLVLKLTTPWNPPLRCDDNGVGCCRGDASSPSRYHHFCSLRAELAPCSNVSCPASFERDRAVVACLFLSRDFPRLGRDYLENGRPFGNPTHAPYAGSYPCCAPIPSVHLQTGSPVKCDQCSVLHSVLQSPFCIPQQHTSNSWLHRRETDRV